MSEDSTPLTEARLTALLEARAERIEVQPDLTSVTLPATDPPHPSRSTRSWWIAVAAVLVVACGAVLLAGPSANTDDTGVPGRLADGLVEFAAPAPRQQLLVWMHPQATNAQVQAVALALGDLPAVERHTYTDHEASYAEFVVYYADQPEVIELVSPERLPTYFRVDTAAPAGVADVVEDLPGVDLATTRQPGER